MMEQTNERINEYVLVKYAKATCLILMLLA